ncbi:DUF3775 domain-containing protein [Alsobacter sp. SYSU M60028]|uniref:DUF3775 domain-containing protein n=1 Tax=Alsobacter ponti TaxID=2962936 RepID=A0ABT1LB36_9HYPH|nr:DUF3775 domain-containing protein [Alsobacter ponti]MCP8938168.1 DUF3775 domain-containing protein [Alsobacter ponti]
MDIALDKVCALIRQARRYDVKEQGPTDVDSGSNPTDDNQIDVLEPTRDDATESEIRSFINGLNVDERANLVALVWVGRGDYEAAEWDEAVRLAQESVDTPTADYLLGIPNLPDLLDEGLAAFDLNCVDENAGAGV